jgi:hypothetical protein
VIAINDTLDEQYQFIENAIDEDQKYMVVQKEQKPLRQKYRNDYLSTYSDSDYGGFIAKIGKICTEVRAKGKTAEAMAEGLQKYLALCDENQKPPMYQAAYMAMGINRDIAYNLIHGRTVDEKKREIVLFAQEVCGVTLEAMQQSGSINPIVGIFWQKVHGGFDEEREAKASLFDQDYQEELSADAIAEKYADMPD